MLNSTKLDHACEMRDASSTIKFLMKYEKMLKTKEGGRTRSLSQRGTVMLKSNKLVPAHERRDVNSTMKSPATYGKINKEEARSSRKLKAKGVCVSTSFVKQGPVGKVIYAHIVTIYRKRKEMTGIQERRCN